MRGMKVAAAALACAALAGCREKQAEGAIPRERFVLANVALRSVSDTAAKGDSLRAAALKKYRVTQADLLRFVRVNARHPDYMQKVWNEVSDSLQHRYDRQMAGSHPGGPNQPGAPPRPPSAGATPDVPTPPVPGAPPGGKPVVVTPSGEPIEAPPPAQPPSRRPPRPIVPAGQTPPLRTPAPPTDRGPMRPAQPTIQRPATAPPPRSTIPTDTL